MVTGDHATTAQAVADAVGLERGGLMQGHDLSEISAEDLSRSIGEYRVFARVDPADKVKIIEAWRRSGATVAMTGDGVNDAPALHRADIGVAMGSGTDVARESAAMILTDDNYATIVSAIAEGRRLFNNLRNVVHYLLSANASEVLYVLAGFLIFGFLGEPILAVQLLWINLLSDALPAIALGMDASTRDVMRDMPGRGRDILSRRNTALLLVQGTLLAIAALLAMLFGSYVLDLDQDTVRTMAFSTLVFSQLLHALSVRAAGGRMRRPGPLMTFSLLGSAILQFAVVYSALGNQVFHTSPLNLDAMLLVIGISILSMVAIRLLDLVIRSTGANR
jgi:Ca2+-transporting ATPase